MTPREPEHPREADAAEYALGTQSLQERRAFERDMAADPSLAAAAAAWHERLAPLADAIPPTDPSPGLLSRILAELDRPAAAGVIAFTDAAEVGRLRRSRSVWRGVAVAAGSLAAALALLLGSGRVPAGRPSGDLVAVVNRSGDLPALIVRVDTGTGLVQIRSVAAETPSDRSLELWSIAPAGAPRSLGLVGAGATRVSVPAGTPLADGTTLAVSVEPRGGSPTGGPTGPVVYSGKLIPERP